MEYQYATIAEAVTDAVPEKTAIVQGARRLRWAEYEDRAACLAEAFAEAGVGPDSKVALFLYNSIEYAEAQFAAYKLRAAPINVNYRYLPGELAYVIDNCDAEVVVYHASLAERVEGAMPRCEAVKLWVEVDDADGGLDGVARYEDVVASYAPAPRIERDDRDPLIIYTGGTTGMPKGVVSTSYAWIDVALSKLTAMVGLDPITDPAAAPEVAVRLNEEGTPLIGLPACPLSHGTGNMVGLITPHLVGGTSVLLESRSLDPAEVWSAVEREAVGLMVIVGDPVARPLLRELDDAVEAGREYGLSSLGYLISSGAMFAADVKAALLERIPDMTITDALGASEGFMAVDITVRGKESATGRWMPLPTTKVFADDGREIAPGSDEIGEVAVGANVPEGYYNDPEKTEMIFREVDGVRYSFPGDMAKLAEDGSLVLLGRGSQCITTGGEKVFPEEVEEVIKTHEGVEDALVFGVPDERYGQRIVSIVAPARGHAVVGEEVIEHVRSQLAGYKAPRAVVPVETVPRTPTGKPELQAARDLFDEGAMSGAGR